MKRMWIPIVAIVCALARTISAQAPPEMPKPGPEQGRLQYFVGRWITEGEAKQSPFGPAGKITGSEHYEWLPGGFFLEIHASAKGPMGDEKGLAVMGYDANERVYTYHAFNSLGMAVAATGSLQGDTWTWKSEMKMGGMPMKGRYTVKELSPVSYRFRFESSKDGSSWSTVMEGKATKVR